MVTLIQLLSQKIFWLGELRLYHDYLQLGIVVFPLWRLTMSWRYEFGHICGFHSVVNKQQRNNQLHVVDNFQLHQLRLQLVVLVLLSHSQQISTAELGLLLPD